MMIAGDELVIGRGCISLLKKKKMVEACDALVDSSWKGRGQIEG
jgi:hypothetical protein